VSACGASIGHKREPYKTAELIEEPGVSTQISRIGSCTFEGNTCACSAVCERTAGQELNPLLLLITPPVYVIFGPPWWLAEPFLLSD